MLDEHETPISGPNPLCPDRMSADARLAEVVGRITGTISYEAFGDVDIVIEAVPEKIEIKKAELSDAELEARIKEKLGKFAKIVDITDVREVEEVECQSVDNEPSTES